MMGWGKWTPDRTGQEQTTKTTTKEDGSIKEESLRTNDGSKEDHQHTWIDKDSEGNLKGGGATPGKTTSTSEKSNSTSDESTSSAKNSNS